MFRFPSWFLSVPSTFISVTYSGTEGTNQGTENTKSVPWFLNFFVLHFNVLLSMGTKGTDFLLKELYYRFKDI